MKSNLVTLTIIVLSFSFQSVYCRKCAYFRNYPDLTNITYVRCSAEEACCEGYASKAEDACCGYGQMWWILFIVIAAVVSLVVAVVLIACLVKKGKDLEKEKLLKENQNPNKYNPYASAQEPIVEISNDKEEINHPPQYISLFERQATTINNDDSSAPVLAATHIIDKDAINVKSNNMNLSTGLQKPRTLPPIKTNINI